MPGAAISLVDQSGENAALRHVFTLQFNCSEMARNHSRKNDKFIDLRNFRLPQTPKPQHRISSYYFFFLVP